MKITTIQPRKKVVTPPARIPESWYKTAGMLKGRKLIDPVRYQRSIGADQTLPKSLLDAAGLLKKKYPALKKHYQKIRKEWPSYSRK